MRAMLLRRHARVAERPLELVDLPVPVPAAGEIRVRVRVCAVCRTDRHVIEGEVPGAVLPLVLGHQAVGAVDALGPGTSTLKLGQRVGIAWLRHTCGQCGFCTSGRENLCRASRYTGCHADGGYAEWATAPEAYVYPIPDTFEDAEAAPLLCAGIVGFRALERTALPRGGKLGLYGFGSSAHVVLQLALHRGVEVYVATRGASHRALARRLGAHWVGETFEQPPAALDGAIVFAPAGEVVPAALRAVGPGGIVTLAGLHMTPVPELEYESCLFHEKELRSVEANTRADGAAFLAEAAEIPLRPEVALFPLEQANDVLAHLAQDRLDGTAVLCCA